MTYDSLRGAVYVWVWCMGTGNLRRNSIDTSYTYCSRILITMLCVYDWIFKFETRSIKLSTFIFIFSYAQ